MCIAFQQIFFTISDFYITVSSLGTTLIDMGYLTIATGISIFILLQKKVLSLKSHYIFTLVSIILLALLFLVPRHIQIVMALILGVIIATLFLVFSRDIIKASSLQEKKYFILFVLGVVYFAIGEAIKSDFITSIHIVFYLTGECFMLLGLIVGNFALMKLPEFTEIGWSKALKEIFVIHRSGIPILHAKFEKGQIKDTTIDTKSFLTSGIFTALQSAVSDILGSKKNRMTVNKDAHKILLEKSENILVVVISEKDYTIIMNKMHQFIREFCRLFREDLATKPIDISKFKVGYSLIEDIFREK